MAATTGYSAGIETNDVVVSYGIETTWGTAPAVQFQAIRVTGESLTGSKTRQRPGELNPIGEAVQAVTAREGASGSINYALSYGTFDDFFAGVLNADWQVPQEIAGSSGDITLTNLTSTTATLSSTTTGKFTNLAVGQWIRILGFTNAANNGLARVSAKASNQSLTLTTLAAAVTETPSAANAQVRASTIVNAGLFKSLYVQRKFASALFFRYPGAFITGMTLQGSVGGYVQGSFDLVAQSETSSTSDASTGAVLAAPTGGVHDSISGFGGFLRNEVAPSAALVAFSLRLSRDQAQAEYGMGSSAAVGMTRGTLMVSGSIDIFFKDFTQYALFKAETLGRISFVTKDPAGNAYVVTVLNAALMNPQISAGGPGSTVLAKFQIEGNPQSGGGTIQIDRLPAS